MSIIKGQDVIIALGGTAIAAAKSCDIETDVELIEVSSPTTGVNKTYITGKKDWAVSVSGLITDMQALMQTGNSYTLTCAINGSVKIRGPVICKSVKVTGSIGNLTTGTYQFQGNGAVLFT